MIIRHLSIDCAYINKILEPITQREHGVTEFEIEVKNHGADIDLSECTLATYYGLKPDEHKVGVECRVDKDKDLIYLPLYLQMTTAEGVLKGIVELQFPEGNVRFSGVNFKVSSAPDDTKVESTDDFNILENFLSKPTTDGNAGQVLSIDDDGNTIWRTLKEFDGDYTHLSNRPSINGVELNGDKSLEDLNIKQTYTADDISFADGETFQQKFNNGELKGQDGVSGADGITPHIGDNGNWFIGETDTNKPSQGANGTNGNDGIGVAKSEVNTSGELVITYSNGDSTNLGKIVGKDGLDGTNGQNGLSAYEIAKNGGFIGTEEDWLKSLKGADGAKGEKGEQGIQGEKGADGKTPVKGTDYFTAEDKTEFVAEVTESLKPEFGKKQDKLTAGSVTTDNIASKAVTMEKLAEDVTNQFSELKDDLVNLYSLNNIKIIETLSNYAIDKMAYSSTGVLGNNDSIVCTEKMLLKSKTVYCDSKILLYALFDSNKNFISRTSLSTSSNIVTIDDDKACYIALMFNRNAYDFDVIKASNIKGVCEIISPVVLNVGVEKEYTRVIDALRVAENITDKKVIINIFEGTYDIYSELGGDDFVASISSTAIWSDIQPVLKGNVDIIGHGDVSLMLNIPSAVKNSYPYQATRISIINNKGSILIKNIKFITSNNRYCVHDEVDNNSTYDNSEHKFIGCKFISTHAMHNVGMGVGHSIYSFENCYFEHNYGSCLYIHGWHKLLGAKITISNCILNNTHSYGKGLNFGVNSANETDVLILSSYMKNIYVNSENTSIYAKNIYRIICLNCNVTEVLYADSITDKNIAPKLFN